MSAYAIGVWNTVEERRSVVKRGMQSSSHIVLLETHPHQEMAASGSMNDSPLLKPTWKKEQIWNVENFAFHPTQVPFSSKPGT